MFETIKQTKTYYEFAKNNTYNYYKDVVQNNDITELIVDGIAEVIVDTFTIIMSLTIISGALILINEKVDYYLDTIIRKIE